MNGLTLTAPQAATPASGTVRPGTPGSERGRALQERSDVVPLSLNEVPCHQLFSITETEVKARPIGVFCQLNPLHFDGLGEPANCGPTVLNFHLMDELASSPFQASHKTNGL